MSGAFAPEFWADHMLDSFKYSSGLADMFRSRLEAGDRFLDQPYDEAVAWAALLDILVLKSQDGLALSETFRLIRPGHAPVVVPVCSPAELITTLRALAAGTLDLAKISANVKDSIQIRRRPLCTLRLSGT